MTLCVRREVMPMYTSDRRVPKRKLYKCALSLSEGPEARKNDNGRPDDENTFM